VSSWSDARAEFRTYLQAAGQSPGAIRLKTHYVARLARIVPDPWAATECDLLAFLAGPTWKPETRKSARSSLRKFYSWALDAGHLTVDPAARLPKVRVPMGKPRPTPVDVFTAALEAAEPRVWLMILLALLAGLRRGEIAGLHTNCIEGDRLRIEGKGGVTRVIPLHPDLAEALEQVPDGWVFPPVRYRRDGHISADYVGKQVTAVLGGFTAHTLRHAAASRWLAATGNLIVVRDLLGHASVATTQRYTATPQDALRSATGADWH
jgi:integrase